MLERIQEVWPLMRDSFPGLLLKGLEVTLPLALIAFSIGLVIAIITALVQFAKIKVLSQLARVYIWIIRGTPLLVQLYVLFYMFPKFFDVVLDPFPTAIIALSLNEGAYCAETMRAALESVPYGQFEAGYCVGMSYMQIIFRIVLPQALRTAFPPLSNSLISMVKDTSLVANITVMEMLYDARRIMSRKHETLALYIVVAVIYLLFCSVLTLLQRYGEKLLARKGMKKA
ncbi:MAG: amino acid ABC transporter permease [Clostridiales bacterium]|nr:amino acid ABC transporter permease [Clostridiales bacterium]